MNLNENLIETCGNLIFTGSLNILELRKNKLTDCKGLGITVSELYLADNKITNVIDLNGWWAIIKLNLRNNKITTLDN